MEKKAAKIISYITIAPVLAFGMFTLLYFTRRSDFQGLAYYILSVIYFTVLPISAYPIQKFLPKFKDKGRDGQRKLAFIMVVIGYTLGIISALLLKAPKNYLTIYIAYFLSGVILTLINKLLKIKASGHACGVMGPVLICIYFIGKYSWFFLLIIPIVFWSRLKMGRHTLRELLLGTSVSLFCGLLSIAVTH